MSLKFKGFKIIAICVLVVFATIALRVDLLAAPKKAKPQPVVEKKVTAAAKFQDLLRETDKVFEGMEADLAKKKDVSPKLQQLRQHRADLQAQADNIRGELAQTRQELISKKLPAEIIQRHDAFAQNFEQNMKAFLVDLDQAEQAKPGQLQARVKGARDFLKKNIHRERHIPLDPNKLPNSIPKIERKEPRLKKKDFERDFLKPQKAEASRKPILVAANGPLKGISTSSEEQDTGNLSIAQAGNQPAADDLAQTIEVQFTPEIVAKAQELGNDPVKIYEWVRDNIEFVPTYGSIQGAHMTLIGRQGNAFDTASLLIALLRASNIPARYVHGTIEVPIDKAMNWVGGFADAKSAMDFISSGGVPVSYGLSGGKISDIWMEHVWVETYVPYGNYRGARRDDSIKTWIPLDPNYKQYDYKRGMDLHAAMGINGEQYIMDYLTDTSPSPIPSELQDLFPNFTISPYQYYSNRLFNYLDANFPDTTIEDIVGDETIELAKNMIRKGYPYLPASLPYKVLAKGATYSAIPDALRPRIGFAIENILTYETDLSYTITLPEISAKRITLSYIPATSADESLVTQYGGNMLNVPPYLLEVKPVIKINGSMVATGNAVGLGYEQIFNISFQIPNKAADVVTHKVTAGDYSGVAIQYYKPPLELVGDKMEELTKNRVSTDLDDLLGLMLYNIGLSYLQHITFEEELYAKNFQMIVTKEQSEAMATSHAETEWLWGVPYAVIAEAIGVDARRNLYMAFPIDGNQQRTKDFMVVSGIGRSLWEDLILESFFNIPSVSSARLLKLANQQGIPLYTIDKSNVSVLLPQLQVTLEAIADIENAVNAGKKVIISKTNIQYNDWNGVGYIILDAANGTGAYLISGGLAGGKGTDPLPNDHRELQALYKRICMQKREIILTTAFSLIGTPYKWRCKDPEAFCKGVDCSGLVCYVYLKAGINSVGCTHDNPKNAEMQRAATEPTKNPLVGDLVFWDGTYDHDSNCLRNITDGATHVGIAFRFGWMIHARYKKRVETAKITVIEDTLPEERATGLSGACNEKAIIDAFNNKHECIGMGDCYNWVPTGYIYQSFSGYGYAKEFDECPEE